MKVTLLNKPTAECCRIAAAICTNYPDKDKALRGAMASGHESVIEHAIFTFLVEDVSRVLLAQLTRHRLASFSVESQRYVNQENAGFVVPESVRGTAVETFFTRMNEMAMNLYTDAIAGGVPEEDARYILPQGIKTRLVMSMNPRELRHFLALRMCNRAQWEIRQLADEIYDICRCETPELMRGAGCGCMTGRCPEGKRACGHPRKAAQE